MTAPADLDTLATEAAMACLGRTVTRLPTVLRPYLDQAAALGAARERERAEARWGAYAHYLRAELQDARDALAAHRGEVAL